MIIHLYYKPQPKKDLWVLVKTKEDDPQFNTWDTAEDARRHFEERGYPVEMREEHDGKTETSSSHG